MQEQPPPTTKEGSFIKTCLVGCLIMMVLMLVIVGAGSFWLYRNAGRLAADFGSKAIDSVVDQSDIPEADKVAIKAQVARVAEAAREGQITMEDLAKGLEELAESPVMVVIVVQGVSEVYLKKSGLSEEEQEAGKLALQRVGRGCIEKRIPEEDVKELLKVIGTQDEQGNVQIKEQLTDDELRLFLAEAEQLADQADVPNEPFDVDLADEVRKIVDSMLAERTGEP